MYSSLELGKDFKPINISINDVDKFEKKLTKKRTFTNNTWYGSYDWLIDYIYSSLQEKV